MRYKHFLSWMIAISLAGVADAQASISDPGSIKQMSLPAGWKQTDNNRASFISTRLFKPDATDAASIAYSTTSTLYQYPKEQAARIRAILDGPLHSLKPAEVKEVSAVLGQWDDMQLYRMTSARTEVLNGRRVAVLEGDILTDPPSPPASAFRFYVVRFIDRSGGPRQVSYTGQEPLFTKYRVDLKKMLDSIQWE